MEESILKTIKRLIFGVDVETADDSELIILINASLSKLYQLGIGDKPFRITGESETWDTLLTKEEYLETIKEYIYIDVRLIFDPPTSSIVAETLKEIRKEDQWRIASEIDMSSQKG